MSFRRRVLPRPSVWLPLLVLAPLLSGCSEEYPLSIFRPVTEFGIAVNDLFAYIFWWTMLVLVIVVTALLVVVLRFRDRPGRAEPRPVYGHTGLEVGWTLGPAIIVAFIAVPTVTTIFATQREAAEEALVIDVIAHQWWWEFNYPQYEVVTASDLHLPVGREVVLRLRSADVIHSFWVPRLGGKRDTNPGAPAHADPEKGPSLNRLVFTVDSTGIFPGVCAEFCGLSHAIMRKFAVAVTQEEFERWIEEMRTPLEPEPGTRAEEGRDVFFRYGCQACHAIEGTLAVGVIGPSLTRFGNRISIGAGLFENNHENLVRWIDDPPAVKPGARMPRMGLRVEELEAVADYLLSLRSPELTRAPGLQAEPRSPSEADAPQ